MSYYDFDKILILLAQRVNNNKDNGWIRMSAVGLGTCLICKSRIFVFYETEKIQAHGIAHLKQYGLMPYYLRGNYG